MARAERTPEQKAIWEGILKLADELPQGDGGTGRSAGEFTEEAVGAGLDATGRATYTTYNADGTKNVYEVEVKVAKRVDSNDEYWGMQIEDRNGALVINGKHYRIGKNNGRTARDVGFKGFGGRKFEIQYLAADPRLPAPAPFVVDDLWFQGAIPPKFRELAEFQDNARFVDPNQEPFRS